MPCFDSSFRRAPRGARHLAVVAALTLAATHLPVWAAAAEPAPASAATGARLFSGETRFAGGGPPCAACHAVAGLAFPGGGVMGPDLTGSYRKYGPEALETVLATLFFPTMNPVFAGRLLSPAEQADLEAFLATTGTAAAPAVTGRLLVVALLLLAATLALLGWLGRSGLRGVRAGLVASARRAREGRP